MMAEMQSEEMVAFGEVLLYADEKQEPPQSRDAHRLVTSSSTVIGTEGDAESLILWVDATMSSVEPGTSSPA
jgi:hypothetical protein